MIFDSVRLSPVLFGEKSSANVVEGVVLLYVTLL